MENSTFNQGKNNINFFSTIKKEDFDFEDYYINQLNKAPKEYPIYGINWRNVARGLWSAVGIFKNSKNSSQKNLEFISKDTKKTITMSDINRDNINIYKQIEELKLRLNNFITLDVLIKIEHKDNADYRNSTMLALQILPLYLTPFIPKNTRITKIKDVMTGKKGVLGGETFVSQFYSETFEWDKYTYLKKIPKYEVEEFLEKLIRLSVEYSALSGDQNKEITAGNVLKTGVKAAAKKTARFLAKTYRLALPADVMNIKTLLGAMYFSIGHYIINREYLQWNQKDAVDEALDTFRKVKIYRVRGQGVVDWLNNKHL